MNKRVFLSLTFGIVLLSAIAQLTPERATVFFTSEISPESLVKIYQALGKEAIGNVAVKISTGESAQSNHLRPELIAPLVKSVNGTLVECNTAYPGNRFKTADHKKAIEERGYGKIAPIDIMDEEGYIDLPMKDTIHLKFDRVGSHIANYDFLINLAHFKGHAMGGFGGVLKNQSIGIASSEGKALIHTAGVHITTDKAFDNPKGQDSFLESMAGAAQAVHDYFNGNILYINVMNNLSIDCDCDGHPHAPEMKDIGILASLDPVALDKACLDLVFHHESTPGDNSNPLIERINSLHGAHIVDYAEQIGLGTKGYELIDITYTDTSNGIRRYNVYDLKGKKVLSNTESLSSLKPGSYIVNGKKEIVK